MKNQSRHTATHATKVAIGVIAGGILAGTLAFMNTDLTLKDVFESSTIPSSAPAPSSAGVAATQRSPHP